VFGWALELNLSLFKSSLRNIEPEKGIRGNALNRKSQKLLLNHLRRQNEALSEFALMGCLPVPLYLKYRVEYFSAIRGTRTVGSFFGLATVKYKSKSFQS
jgi:hypothetical protein